MKILWYACAERILFGVYVAALDLIIRGGPLMTATSVASADIGMCDGVIVQLGRDLVRRQELDATGLPFLDSLPQREMTRRPHLR